MYSEFDDIVNRLKQGRTWDFPGGVFPPEQKSLSNQNPITTVPLPDKLYVTVKQHIGVEGQLIVKQGDTVLKGQTLTRSMNPFSVPVHAPTSGTITRIGKHVSAHASGLEETTVEIEPDHLETWTELTPLPDYQQMPKIKTIEAICNAGISGMGGAGFPTHIKAAPKKDVEFLIINGVECEPYITSDDRLMREHAWQIRQGMDVLTHLLSPRQIIVAIEDNKPQAIEAMQVACGENPQYLVCPVATKYPAGGEKQLIQMLTNREVPNHGLPIDVGVMMQNVGTCYAIADAIFGGKPLIQRVVTLTGKALNKPGNVWALMGTPMSHLLRFAEYQNKRQKKPKIIMGGPMMGFDVASDSVPVIKTTNCMLVPASEELPDDSNEQPCIRCGACADACPATLLPQQLFWHSKAKELDKAREYNLFDCIECGACAYVCPSEIPLVHYYRVAKAEVRNQEHEKDKAEKARERFEARKVRLLKEQEEREERHRKAAEARKQKMEQDGGDAKDKIAAALARAKAKKSQQSESSAEATADTAKQDKVAAAIARAKAKKAEAEAAAAQTPSSDSSAADEKKEKVAAAIARAKAKKAAATSGVPAADNSAAEEKKDKVAAAIAKAKATRQQANADTKSDAPTSTPEQDIDAEQAKKARVAAAVAKAKAKRDAAKQQKQEADPQPDSPDEKPQSENKQDKVAAAIAKAKAKALARQQQKTPSAKPDDSKEE